MNKTMSIIIAVLLVLVLALGVLAGVSKGFQDWDFAKSVEQTDNESEEPTEDEDDSALETISAARVLLFSGEAYASSETDSINKTLTASILPIDAIDKSVDWSVAWSDDATRKGEPVTNYVTVTPETDGSLTATVSCYQGFEGDIAIITVTTRAGGFSASCTVSFVGTPESMNIVVSDYNVVHDESWDADMVEMYCNDTYLVPITLDNTVHHVGASFADNYVVTIEAHGGVNTKTDTFDSEGTSTGTNYGVCNLNASNLWEANGFASTSFSVSGGLVTHVKASIQDGQLKIETGNAITALYGYGVGRGGSAKMYFESYLNGQIPYATITVTETSTGISQSINIRTIATVQSVALSASTLTF